VTQELTALDIIFFELAPAGKAAPSNEQICNLEAGKTYYFNLVLDGLADGMIDVAGTSNGCENPEAGDECGMGLQYLSY
jgi:hypothetical protein